MLGVSSIFNKLIPKDSLCYYGDTYKLLNDLIGRYKNKLCPYFYTIRTVNGCVIVFYSGYTIEILVNDPSNNVMFSDSDFLTFKEGSMFNFNLMMDGNMRFNDNDPVYLLKDVCNKMYIELEDYSIKVKYKNIKHVNSEEIDISDSFIKELRESVELSEYYLFLESFGISYLITHFGEVISLDKGRAKTLYCRTNSDPYVLLDIISKRLGLNEKFQRIENKNWGFIGC